MLHWLWMLWSKTLVFGAVTLVVVGLAQTIWNEQVVRDLRKGMFNAVSTFRRNTRMRKFVTATLAVIMLALGAAVAQGQAQPRSVAAMPKGLDTSRYPIFHKVEVMSAERMANLSLRPIKLDTAIVVFNWVEKERRFHLDTLPAGVFVAVDSNGVYRYRIDCSNRLVMPTLYYIAIGDRGGSSLLDSSDSLGSNLIPPAPATSGGPGIGERFANAFRSTAGGLATLAGWLLPLLILGLIIAGLIWLWRSMELGTQRSLREDPHALAADLERRERERSRRPPVPVTNPSGRVRLETAPREAQPIGHDEVRRAMAGSAGIPAGATPSAPAPTPQARPLTPAVPAVPVAEVPPSAPALDPALISVDSFELVVNERGREVSTRGLRRVRVASNGEVFILREEPMR